MTRAGPCVLAVDLGTTGPKAAVVSLNGRILATGRAPVATLFQPDGGAGLDLSDPAVARAFLTHAMNAFTDCSF